MFPWKIVFGTLIGAVLVKEWQEADALYTWIRKKVVAGMERAKRGLEAENGKEHFSSPDAD
ncbi:MAG: hypothetical protein QF662_01610 [Phycisphaerae bacterium]|jgi:hypothetical protein|nr:hypothetical protein [Phycisphaerae bacterium]